MAAAEKAVAPPVSEDASISVGVHLPHTCPAPDQAGPAENGVLTNGNTAEHAEVSSPRALNGLESAEAATPDESAPVPQNGYADVAAPVADSAQRTPDAPESSVVADVPAAVQPDEAGVQGIVPAAAGISDAKPEAGVKHADSSAGADVGGKKRARRADEGGREHDMPEPATAAAEEAAASEPEAPAGEASRKKLKKVAAAAKETLHADAEANGVQAPEQSARAAVPKAQRKRKAASADSEAAQAAGTASTTPESQPSKSLSRRTLRSNPAVQDTAAAGEHTYSASKKSPAAETRPGTAKAQGRPRRQGAAAELAPLEQAGVVSSDSPRHGSNAKQPVKRRALRSQTAEPEQAATPNAGQLAPAGKPASRRALRSQSSMSRDGALSQEGSRAGTAAASPEEGLPPLGSGQPVPVPGSTAVQGLLGRSLSQRRRTRSNAQEYSAAEDLVAGASAAPLSELEKKNCLTYHASHVSGPAALDSAGLAVSDQL